MKRILSGLVLGAALLVPIAAIADDHDRDNRDHGRRYYDRDAKDYHRWNDNENRAYRRYWEDNRRGQEYREINRLKRNEQSEYWRWRHQHSDTILFEVRP